MDENYGIQYDEECYEDDGILQGSVEENNEEVDVDDLVLGLRNLDNKSKSVLLALLKKTKS